MSNTSTRDPYEVSSKLRLFLMGNKHNSSPLEVTIIKQFFPFTSAVVLLVGTDSAGLPPTFILKLADRRFMERPEGSEWSPSKEVAFRREFSMMLDRKHLDLEHLPKTLETDLDDVYNEFDRWVLQRTWHKNEFEAYLQLKELQGSIIPRFFARVQFSIAPKEETPLPVDIVQGLALEYISGISMADLKVGVDISFATAEDVSQKVLALVRQTLDRYVRHNEGGPYDPALIDFGYSAIDTTEISWDDMMEVRFYLRLHRVNSEGQREYAWHRYQTPVIIEPDDGANSPREKMIEALPEDERNHSYERVENPKPGEIRWRIRIGMKTRAFGG
ncbi:hypothetical protein BDP27DRAFT_1431046 [Rhodocollybia butyracea]|uniref:Uncharacterized protein n=1 Tax=Rhodocollybia butyracea TaxID=206335 RepID=A0A9P5TZN6_9AGAR|nr:hypothetical protein BDP27DRAFT_1431046 [Rhodocollybia butyracea]